MPKKSTPMYPTRDAENAAVKKDLKLLKDWEGEAAKKPTLPKQIIQNTPPSDPNYRSDGSGTPHPDTAFGPMKLGWDD
jgi:hypothetical protein